MFESTRVVAGVFGDVVDGAADGVAGGAVGDGTRAVMTAVESRDAVDGGTVPVLLSFNLTYATTARIAAAATAVTVKNCFTLRVAGAATTAAGVGGVPAVLMMRVISFAKSNAVAGRSLAFRDSVRVINACSAGGH